MNLEKYFLIFGIIMSTKLIEIKYDIKICKFNELMGNKHTAGWF